MAALTWRNVTGASAGNPGSTLATGASAFANASRGSLALVESIRKGNAIKNEQATQQAIADVMASGKPLDGSTLQDFAPGVDTSKVLESVYGAERDRASIAFDRERTETEALNNDPATVQRRRAHEDRMASLQEAQLATRNAELAARQAAVKTTERIRGNATKLDTAWDQFRTEGLSAKEQATQDTIARIQASDLPDDQKITMIDAANQELSMYSGEFDQQNLGRFLSDFRKNNAGVSSEAYNASRAGQLDNILKERAQDRSDLRTKADIEYAKRQDTLLNNIRGGTSLHAMALDENGTPVPIMDKQAALANKMNKTELYEIVRSKGTDFLGITKDDEIPPIAKKRLDALWDTLGGNRSAITQLMDNSDWSYDTEWLLMPTDEVHNLPPLRAAQELASKFKQAANVLYQNNAKVGVPGAQRQSGLDSTLNAINAQLTQRQQQATAQRYGGGMFDQGLAQQLQDTITRLSAPKIGAPDPRLQR